MNRNDDVFESGFEHVDDSWVNNANRGSNASYFNWGPTTEGRGIKTFGQTLANTKAFPDCMAKRAFRALCKREPVASDQAMLTRVSQEFANDNFNLTNLFSRIVVTRECLGAGVGQ
jgi:hypothetical protein